MKLDINDVAIPSQFLYKKCVPSHAKKNTRRRTNTSKPKAGSTSVKIQNTSDLAVDKDADMVAGWREVDPSMVQVRGTITDICLGKNKVNSLGDLYRCVKEDVF